MRLIRRIGVHRLPITRAVFDLVGIFPLHDHYHDPYVSSSAITKSNGSRTVPGIDLNVEGQLELLRHFNYTEEVRRFPHKASGTEFYYQNRAFGPGDAECLYSVIRHFKPRRIVEIGCGHTTRLIQAAIRQNTNEGANQCVHVCIDPYATPRLPAETSIQLVQRRVEELNADFFEDLDTNDLLFIDSSHVVRMGGDVVKLYLQVVPALRPGVLIHVHDVFTPRDYPPHWRHEKGRFWTEQYLVEALLSCSSQFSVLLAVSYLAKMNAPELAAACPVWAAAPDAANPGSFWFVRRGS
jgi:hypothetical protein